MNDGTIFGRCIRLLDILEEEEETNRDKIKRFEYGNKEDERFSNTDDRGPILIHKYEILNDVENDREFEDRSNVFSLLNNQYDDLDNRKSVDIKPELTYGKVHYNNNLSNFNTRRTDKKTKNDENNMKYF